jgi:hypothetical protein
MGPTGALTCDGFVGGNMTSQLQAARILPVLVRLATTRRTATYKEIADEVGIFWRIGYQLGLIGGELERIAARWGKQIPPIECLAVNGITKMPSDGVAWFVGKEKYLAMSDPQKRIHINGILEEVFSYQRWHEVLAECGLQPAGMSVPSGKPEKVDKYGRCGEGPAHKALKQYVASHPELFGVVPGAKVETEAVLPSGDVIDVLFTCDTEWIGIEVKSEISSEEDIKRGFFQHVKYSAVLNAMRVVAQAAVKVRVVLVIAAELPAALVSYRNTLQVTVRTVLPTT